MVKMMKKTVWLAGLLFALPLLAQTPPANPPQETPPAQKPPSLEAPPMAAPIAVYNWTGFYIGGNIGYGWGQADNSFGPLPTAAQFVNLLPLTPETEKLMDGKFLAQMKRGALLVNAGRGKTVDTEALTEALRSGHIRAALDVTDPEPLPSDHPLWREPNVLITPHVAGSVQRWEARGYRFAGEQIRRFVAGQPLLGVEAGNTSARRGA